MGAEASLLHRLHHDRGHRSAASRPISGLGRNEDPAFTFRTMVVQAAWPGATIDDTLQQVTERLERTLQETQGPRFSAQLHEARASPRSSSTLKGSTTAAEVPDIWYQVRKSIGDMRHTLPAGVVGPGFNDEFGDTYRHSSTASPRTASPIASCATMSRTSARACLQVPDVSKIEILGAQDEQIFVEFSTQQLAGLGIDRAALIAALQAQNAVSPAGSMQTGDEKLSLRVSGAFRSEQDILDINFVVQRPADPAARHRAGAPRLRRSAAADVPRQRQAGDRPRHRHARGRRHSGARPQREEGDRTRSPPICRSASSRRWSPISRSSSKHAISEFIESLWQAIAIIMAVSFVSLGVRPGAVVALSIPLTLAIVFPIMELLRHRSAAHFARRADHRPRPARRRRHDDGRRHDVAARRRRQQG